MFACFCVCTRTRRVSPCTNCSGPSSTRLRRVLWTPEWRKPSTPSTTRACWATMSSTRSWWDAFAQKLPSRTNPGLKKIKSPHGFEIAQQTQSAVTVVTAQNPHRRLPAFVRHPFSLLVFSAQEEKEAAHSHVSGAHAWLQTARAGTRSPSLHQRVVWICVSVLEANVNAAISF